MPGSRVRVPPLLFVGPLRVTPCQPRLTRRFLHRVAVPVAAPSAHASSTSSALPSLTCAGSRVTSLSTTPTSRNGEAAPPRLPALDGIRAIAVVAVVALHAGMLPWGWVGVDLFFTLSGFLITGILVDARDAGGSGWVTYAKPVYMRRLLRIVPVA